MLICPCGIAHVQIPSAHSSSIPCLPTGGASYATSPPSHGEGRLRGDESCRPIWLFLGLETRILSSCCFFSDETDTKMLIGCYNLRIFAVRHLEICTVTIFGSVFFLLFLGWGGTHPLSYLLKNSLVCCFCLRVKVRRVYSKYVIITKVLLWCQLVDSLLLLWLGFID